MHAAIRLLDSPQRSTVTDPSGAHVEALVDSALHSCFDSAALNAALRRYSRIEQEFDLFFGDASSHELAFNVLRGRSVREELTPEKYSIGRRCARVEFSRRYYSDMEKSPSHLIFLSALVQWQKLIYLMMCREFNITYCAADAEMFKVWPTDVRCCVPVMVREERSLRQDTVISTIEPRGASKWNVEAFSVVNERLGFVARATVYRIA